MKQLGLVLLSAFLTSVVSALPAMAEGAFSVAVIYHWL
jgi:hypothetical protein